jgi:hypothetical protein
MMTDLYPVTIIADRYSGTYSGGQFAAFNEDPNLIPADALGSDVPCRMFWKSVSPDGYTGLLNCFKEPLFVGLGGTPNEAFKDLILKVEKFEQLSKKS